MFRIRCRRRGCMLSQLPKQGQQARRMKSRKESRGEMGESQAGDLISTLIHDHEQTTPGKSAARTAAAQTPSSPPSESINKPTTSLVSRLWRSRSVSEDMISPAALAIEQSHWKPTNLAAKCAAPDCRKPFTDKSRKRNCAMCGKVFCFVCTNYRRRMDTNARPDPLGHFHSVCRICFNFIEKFGTVKDHMREFQEFRRNRVSLVRGDEIQEEKRMLCLRRNTPSKQKKMREELRRLSTGFQNNQGVMKGLVAEMKVPDWQRSSSWVPSKDVSNCTNCGTSLGILNRKIHCRLGGHVFCTTCTQDNLLLYVDNDEIKWALNGKDGGPTKVPEKFLLLPVCLKCSSDLHEMLVEQSSAPPPPVFLKKLSTLHSQLSTHQAKVNSTLPGYTHLVDSMDGTDNSPDHVQDRHPMRTLIKTQSDLSDAFSSLAVESQKLKLLNPVSSSQDKLLKNVMLGVYRFYSENMYSFRNLKNHLSEIVPMGTLELIQSMLSMQSMERIHVVIQQLMFEALSLEARYKFDNKFFNFIIDIINIMDVEFKSFIDQKGESWDDHSKVVLEFIQNEMKNKRLLIKINQEILVNVGAVHYLVVSQCSSYIHECYRELQAKTIDREFRKVKQCLHDACEQLDMILLILNSSQNY